MSVFDTQPFAELTPAQRQKQFISFAVMTGNQRLDSKVERLGRLRASEPMLPAAKREYDDLLDDIKHISFQLELLKLVALDITP